MTRHPRARYVGVNFNSTYVIEEKLIREIVSLERQLENVELVDNTFDFSMMQTYKEMIHCRREMLNDLPRKT